MECKHENLELIVHTDYVNYYVCIDCRKTIIDPPIDSWNRDKSWLQRNR